jgi:RNA polymerase sigma factor (sigma-70 family)
MPIDPLLVSPPGDSAEPDIVPSSSAGDTPASRDLKAVDALDDGLDVDEGWVLREDVESAYRRLFPQLVRLAYFLVDTVEHAEEAVQDAFAKAYPKWGRIENPDAYMRMAVVRTCRSVQRRCSLVRRTPPERVEYAALGVDHVADVVRRLPVKFRQVVVLRYYLQLSDPEIAATLGMALGTVKSTLHRARAQMKEELS